MPKKKEAPIETELPLEPEQEVGHRVCPICMAGYWSRSLYIDHLRRHTRDQRDMYDIVIEEVT